MEALEAEVFTERALSDPVVMDKLLSQLDDANIFNAFGETLLYKAVQTRNRDFEYRTNEDTAKRYLEVAEVILRHGADPNLYNKKHRGRNQLDNSVVTTPMGYVIVFTLKSWNALYPYQQMIDLLLSYGAHINPTVDGSRAINELEKSIPTKNTHSRNGRGFAGNLWDQIVHEKQKEKLEYLYSTSLAMLSLKSIKKHGIDISMLPSQLR